MWKNQERWTSEVGGGEAVLAVGPLDCSNWHHHRPTKIPKRSNSSAEGGIGKGKGCLMLFQRAPAGRRSKFFERHKIRCGLLNDGVIFLIEWETEWTWEVFESKKVIKERRQLASAADGLALYKVETNISDREHILDDVKSQSLDKPLFEWRA